MEKINALILTTLVTLIWQLRLSQAWTFSLAPNRVINSEMEGPQYFNEGSFFKLLHMDEQSILIGARNNVYNLSLSNLAENVASRIEWPSSDAHREMCMLKGKNTTDCQNYIRIFARVHHQIVLCGTNSFKPACRYYKPNLISSSDLLTYEMIQEFQGEAISPYSPNQNNSYVFSSDLKELYTATTVGFAGSQQLIYRQRLVSDAPTAYSGITPQTLHTESRYDILNQASFVSSMEYNGFMLFFFREQAIEHQECGGKSMYSRVARVCKNDKGGPHPYSDRFSSFLKSRLNCSMPGDFPFYFNEIQATSGIIDGIYGNDKDALIYTVMTTNENAIDGSAICVYSMNSILAGFEGSKFKSQRDVYATQRINESELPSPGQCVEDSRTLPMATVNYVLKNPLMLGAINPIHESPLLVHTGSNYKFTSIAIDPQVETTSGKIYDILFIGTDSGQVLKVINAGSSINEKRPIVVSEQQVLPLGVRIKELKISHETQSLIIIADDYVKAIPLHNCSALSQCSQCIGSRDPYCVWDNINRECIYHNKTALKSKNTQMYHENIDGTSNVNICGGEMPILSETQQPKLRIQQSHGTLTGKGSASSAMASDSENRGEEVDYHHKYAPVVTSANNIHYEPRIQTSSASIVTLFVIAALILGVIFGVAITRCVARDNRNSSFAADNQRNHLGWPVVQSKLPIMNNGGKDINLLMNTNGPSINKDSKKDNLELEFSLGNKDKLHECKNSNESLDKETCKSAVISAGGGTLQKVKKTYI